MSIVAFDILVLNDISEKIVQVSNPRKLITGGSFFPTVTQDLDKFESSIKKLYDEKLLRKNFPKEFLPYLSIGELRNLLEEKGCKGFKKLSKNPLIDFANKSLSDQDIIENNNYKEFYKLTNEGIQSLEKYKNLIWFSKYKLRIFGSFKPNHIFTNRYFFRNPEVDPLEVMLEYFDGLNISIVGKLLLLKNDFEKAMSYAIRVIKLTVESRIKEIAGNVYLMNNFDVSYLMLGEDYWVVHAYDEYTGTDEEINNKIEKSYEEFEFKNIISLKLYGQTIRAILVNQSDFFDWINSQYTSIIKNNFPVKEESELLDESNLQAQGNGAALLDLLIEHLDLSLLLQLKERIEIKIDEYNNLGK